MVVPLRGPKETVGIMTFDRSVCGTYSDAVVGLADVFGKLLATAMTFGEQSARLSRLREQLQEQNRVLREGVSGRTDAGTLMQASQSASMVHVVQLARQVAVTDTPVLITGETGTGKEVLANAIHEWSRRAEQPIVSLNCAALPPGLIESELFGHLRGAFSGATHRRIGRFQAANGGTLFLDEVGELPVGLQAKLLRALQDGCFEPVGSDRTVRVDVRIIAATNVDLLVAVADGRFRQDLYYRLAVFPIHLPPLRERRADVPRIADNVLEALARRTGRGPWSLSEPSRRWLVGQPWPGNVRELVNTLERATILSADGTLELEALASVGATPPAASAAEPPEPVPTLEEMERRHIRRALELTRGKLYGAGGAAQLLGINPNTLRSRMKKLGLGGARSFRG
jgi:transcriptional regulator with GAF, ATPase, and Fis domain